jgi:hypothetical protein
MPDGGRIPGQIVIPNAVEVDLLWNIVPTKQVKNVLHGQVAGGFTATAAVAQAIYAAIIASGQWTSYKAFVNAGCQFAGVAIRDLRTAGMPLVQSTGAATPGTGAGLALPPGVSAVITLRTANAGRNFRGRAYLPGLDSTSLNANTGNFSAAFQTAAQNFMTEVETALTASNITHAIANPARQQYTGKKNAVHPARAAAIVPVTSLLMRSLVPFSQRRRAYVA